MVWVPALAVITSRAIADNLLEYITDKERQAAALAWAGGPNLKIVKRFTNSDRTRPVFPYIEFLNDNDAQHMPEDTLNAAYHVTFQTVIQHSDADTVLANAGIYDKAIRSLVRNCPEATLKTDTGAITTTLQMLEGEFKDLAAGKDGTATNDYYQVMQLRAAYTLTGSAYL